MSKILKAIYDGDVFRPETTTGLSPNTHVKLTVDVIVENSNKEKSFLKTAKSLNIDGPEDWSENFKDYLYFERKHDV